MTNEQRKNWEHDILLRASGELPEHRSEALEQAVASRAKLAEFERFVELDLLEGARAQRDFLAEALAQVEAEEKVAPLRKPGGWWVGAAAVLVLGGVMTLSIRTPNERSPNNTASGGTPIQERGTANLSKRGNELETRLEQARSGLRSSRFAYSETL